MKSKSVTTQMKGALHEYFLMVVLTLLSDVFANFMSHLYRETCQ